MQDSAYDDLPDGVVVADESGTVEVLNRAAARMLRTTSDEARGRPLTRVLPLSDDQGRNWWTCSDPYGGLATRTRQPERRLTLPDGRGVLVTASYVRDAQRRLRRLVVAMRDDRARERVDRSRADLVSTVAHELRSPLTSVKGFTATLLARWDRFSDEQKKVMLQTVNADADRVTRLLTDLLDVSRIDAGRIEMRKQVVDVAASAHKAVAGRVAAGEAPDRFVVRVEGDLPETWADPDKIDQVLGNLVENAVRHGAGTVTLALRPYRGDAPPGSSVNGDSVAPATEVTVGDQGEGIGEDVGARVFTRFWRGNRREGGTGLGLYIVKGLIGAHGGTVSVGRSPSGGAQFRLLLPAGSPPYEE